MRLPPTRKRGLKKRLSTKTKRGRIRDRLIAELRDAVRARDDFLAVAAHELRNPLTPILLSVQLIRGAEQSRGNVKASAELDRLERLIKHFVARTTCFSKLRRLARTSFHLEPAELNLSELIKGIVNDYAPLIR